MQLCGWKHLEAADAALSFNEGWHRLPWSAGLDSFGPISSTHADFNMCLHERCFLFSLWGFIGVEHAFLQNFDGKDAVGL